MVKSIYECNCGKSGGKILSNGNIQCLNCGLIKLKDTGSISVDWENEYKRCYEKLEMLEEHYQGKGCSCGAYSESECGCNHADWTDPEVYRLKNALKKILGWREFDHGNDFTKIINFIEKIATEAIHD